MKKIMMAALMAALLLPSCKSAGNKQDQKAEKETVTEQPAATTGTEAQSESHMTKEELAKQLDDLISKGKEDAAAARQKAEAAGPVEPDAWYARDFSFTMVKFGYADFSTRVPEKDITYIVTRVGNKAWIQVQAMGKTQFVREFEYAGGSTTERLYKDGKEQASASSRLALGQRLEEELVEKSVPIAKPRKEASVKSTREGTCCNRPCQIVEEVLVTSSGNLDRTVYIDKAFGFIYKMHSHGHTTIGDVDSTPYEVIAFTEKPGPADIPAL